MSVERSDMAESTSCRAFQLMCGVIQGSMTGAVTLLCPQCLPRLAMWPPLQRGHWSARRGRDTLVAYHPPAQTGGGATGGAGRRRVAESAAQGRGRRGGLSGGWGRGYSEAGTMASIGAHMKTAGQKTPQTQLRGGDRKLRRSVGFRSARLCRAWCRSFDREQES